MPQRNCCVRRRDVRHQHQTRPVPWRVELHHLTKYSSPKLRVYFMTYPNVIKLVQPGAFTDSLTEILRSGARALLIQSVQAEVAEFLAKHAALRTETGHQGVVRHGHLPERDIMGRRFYHRCPRALRVH